jgi:hypothetical protein
VRFYITPCVHSYRSQHTRPRCWVLHC